MNKGAVLNRRGCSRFGCLVLGLLLVFACGLGLLVYVVIPPPPLDILVLGLDARQGEAASRADSILLAGINPRALQVSLLSIPRDLRLDVPGYGVQPINTANALGEQAEAGSGPALTAASLQSALGIGTDRFVRLRFSDLEALIDAAGGVWVDVERTLRDEAYPLSDTETTAIQFDPGLQWMNGERALQYARTRHADDDYARAGRQQQVVQALARQLLNPLTWPGVFSVLFAIETDLTPSDMALMAPTVLINAGRFEQRTIDRSLMITQADGSAVIDWAALQPWIEAHFD